MFYDDEPGQPFEEGPFLFDYGEVPDWFGNEITIQDQYGELHSMTKYDWYETALLDTDTLHFYYGYDGIDIMLQLWEEGYITDDELEAWRAEYEALYG